MKKQVKTVIKDFDLQKREVKFAFSLFGEYDSDNDVTEKGAFSKTIKESGPLGSNRIKHLYSHEYRTIPPIGVIKEMGETNEYAYAVSKLMQHQLADAILESYDEGAIDEHSYWGKALITGTNEKGGNIIKEVMLREVSTLPWGAQEKAKMIALNKSEIKDVEGFKKHLEDLARWVRKSKASDDILIDIETEILKSTELIDALKLEGRQQTPEQFKPLTLAEIYRIS